VIEKFDAGLYQIENYFNKEYNERFFILTGQRDRFGQYVGIEDNCVLLYSFKFLERYTRKVDEF
jgi:hypothetical protein